MATLDLQGIQCAYGKNVVLDDVNISLNNGVTALLGLNGAGKTTLIKTIMRLIKPKNGKIVFNGEDIYKMKSRYYDYVGYMPALYDNFKAYDFCIYMAALKGISKKEAKEKTDILLEKVMLKDAADRKIRTFSGGMKQRLGIAQALLNNPQLIILDEPTAGLDPNERIKFRNIITELGTERIVILATHIISDIESIAKNIILVRNGKVSLCDNPKKFIDNVYDKVYVIKVHNYADIADITQHFKVSNIRETDDGFEVRVVGDNLENELNNYDISVATPELEDAFLMYF
jgi:ABC-2 type transport system ATP-binding protein